MYSDTLSALTKSTRGQTMLQVFVTDRNYAHAAHISAKSEAGDAVSKIFQSFGVPRYMVTDGAKELKQWTWGKQIKE